MLKITPNREGKSLRIQLCGQFTKEYVREIEGMLTAEAGASETVIDLANVTFVDREAMIFLCSTKSRNIPVENVPSYVRRWIQQEGLCSSSDSDEA